MLLFISLSVLIALARPSSTVSNRNGMNGHSSLIPDLKEKLSAFPLFNVMLAQGLLYITFIMCNYIPSVDFLLNFYYERLSNIVRYFFVSIEMI